jgi:hypothetical protein
MLLEGRTVTMMLRSLSILAVATVSLPMRDARGADPTTADCVGATEAALTSDGQRKLRTERSQLLVCASMTCPTDVRKECLQRIDEVNTQIPTIVFAAKDASGADLGAVRVTMDGELLAERLEGIPISVDPGEHTFGFQAAGQAPVTKTLVIQQAQKDRRELITFGNRALLLASPDSASSKASHTQKTLALVAGGVGVLGLGIGTAIGVMALSKRSDASNLCPNACATQAGVNLWNDASTLGNVSTVGLIVGGVALAGGAVLWFTVPRSVGAVSAQVGAGFGDIQARGSW